MQTLKVQVRIECAGASDERSVAFWRESGELCCFTWFDGHNTASDNYRLSLPVASHSNAAELMESLQRHYDSLPGERVRLELVQRLPRQ